MSPKGYRKDTKIQKGLFDQAGSGADYRTSCMCEDRLRNWFSARVAQTFDWSLIKNPNPQSLMGSGVGAPIGHSGRDIRSVCIEFTIAVLTVLGNEGHILFQCCWETNNIYSDIIVTSNSAVVLFLVGNNILVTRRSHMFHHFAILEPVWTVVLK